MSEQGEMTMTTPKGTSASTDFRFSKARTTAGLSQQQLAESSGCSLTKIRALEAGKVSLGDEETARVMLVLLERIVGAGSTGRGYLELMRSYQKLSESARSGLRQFLRNLDE